MKKIIILVSIFLLQITSLFADSFTDNFPQPFFAFLTLDSKWANELLGYTGRENETSKAYKEITSCLKERFSVDIENDLERCSVFVVPSISGAGIIGVFTGKFNTNNLISMIKSLLPKENQESVKLESLTINGKNVQALVENDNRLIFYNNETILFATNDVYQVLKQNSISFSKAPSDITDLIGNNKRFLYISKSAVMVLSMFGLPAGLVGNVNSLAVFIDNDNINIEMNFADSSSAEQMKSVLKNMIKEYSNSYSKEFDKQKKALDDIFVGDLSTKIFEMYNAAKGKDLIDSLNFNVKGNNLSITTEANVLNIITGITGGFASAYAMSRRQSGGNPPFNRDIKAICHSNIRVLSGGVEMYNMDHSTMMSTLNIDTLIKEKYIKYPPQTPDPECEYYSEGDLAKDGFIACKKHGPIPEQK